MRINLYGRQNVQEWVFIEKRNEEIKGSLFLSEGNDFF